MTFISYPNITATSENGRFRIEIKGAPSTDSFRDQSNFIYRLVTSEEIVWEWTVEGTGVENCVLDDYPHDAWVNDDGWVVVRTHGWFNAGLMVFSSSGEVVLRSFHRRFLDDEPGFLDEEPEGFMGESSAGPFWARYSIAYFVKHNGREFWVLRTWWGHRVVIDLDRAKIVNGTQIEEEVTIGLEKACVQRLFEENIDRLEAVDPDLPQDYDNEEFRLSEDRICTAGYHAGWLQAEESIPYLRRLEVLGVVGGSCCRVPWAEIENLTFRQIAKLSLLRMGEEPLWYSQYRFRQRNSSSEDEYPLFDFPEQVQVRSPHLLEIGLTQKEVLCRIGAPEFIGDVWEYDMPQSVPPCTIRVSWDESHLENLPYEVRRAFADQNPPRIAGLEILEPQWELVTRRDTRMI